MVFYVECFGLMPFKIRSPELGEVNLHSRKIGICHGAGIPPGIIQTHNVEDKKNKEMFVFCPWLNDIKLEYTNRTILK